jgi:hypothetical protein
LFSAKHQEKGGQAKMTEKLPLVKSEYYKLLEQTGDEGAAAAAMAQKWNISEDLVLSFVLFLASY